MSENIKDIDGIKGTLKKETKVYKNKVAERVSYIGTLASVIGYITMVVGPTYTFFKYEVSASSILLEAIIVTICFLSSSGLKGLAEVIELLQDIKDK